MNKVKHCIYYNPDCPICFKGVNKEKENWEDKSSFIDDFWQKHSPAIVVTEKGKIEKSLLQIISRAIQQQKEKDIAEIRQRIGALRQWLNEDRISNPERMVTNEQIERWLKIRGEE